jgi:hypothetical protein
MVHYIIQISHIHVHTHTYIYNVIHRGIVFSQRQEHRFWWLILTVQVYKTACCEMIHLNNDIYPHRLRIIFTLFSTGTCFNNMFSQRQVPVAQTTEKWTHKFKSLLIKPIIIRTQRGYIYHGTFIQISHIHTPTYIHTDTSFTLIILIGYSTLGCIRVISP